MKLDASTCAPPNEFSNLFYGESYETTDPDMWDLTLVNPAVNSRSFDSEDRGNVCDFVERRHRALPGTSKTGGLLQSHDMGSARLPIVTGPRNQDPLIHFFR